MAIAALAIKEGRIFASPETVARQDPIRIIHEDQPIDSRSITCIKLGREGEYGIIKLAQK
jgi:hypothetical protein